MVQHFILEMDNSLLVPLNTCVLGNPVYTKFLVRSIPSKFWKIKMATDQPQARFEKCQSATNNSFTLFILTSAWHKIFFICPSITCVSLFDRLV